MKYSCLLQIVLFSALIALSTAANVQVWGDSGPSNSELVYDDFEVHPPRQGGVRIAKFNFPTFVEDEGDEEIIFIRVTSYRWGGRIAHAQVIFGGPGSNHVGLLFSSAGGIYSRIQIWQEFRRQ